MRKLLAVATKEMRQIKRDLRTLLILLIVPIYFLLLYGYALNFDIRHVRLAVQDRDHSEQSRQIISAFVNSGYFDLAAVVTSDADADDLIDRDRARAVLVIPEQVGRRLLTNQPAQVQVLINGDNANTAATVMGYASSILAGVSANLQVAASAPLKPPVSLEPRVWFNPELRSTLFLVPGLIAYIAMITAVLSTALSVVREKERGTMEQIRMAPINAAPYILGKTAPYFALSMTSSLLIVLASMALFDMPMRGSWGLLFLSSALFLTSALGFGLMISTVADSQDAAFQLSMLASFLPTFLLSGFVFPIENMPRVLQLITYVVPARYYIVTLRAILLKGVGFEVLQFELAALAAFSTVALTLASVRLAREKA